MWWDPWENRPATEETDEYELPTVEVIMTDNPVVAMLYGPDGELLLEVRERPPLGFQPPEAP